MLTSHRKRLISRLAEDTATIYFPSSIILPEPIATDNGVTFSYGNYGDCFDGLIEQLDGAFHIYINQDKAGKRTSTRSRFTFGHELGHFFLDEHRLALVAGRTPSHPSTTDFSSKNPVELEADYFACALLMPEARFIADCHGQLPSRNFIRSLAAKYQTSVPATLLRYANIGNHPIAVVCSRHGRILWHWRSEDFAYSYLKTAGSTVSAATAVGEYYARGRRYDTPEKVYVEEWFNYTPCEPKTCALNEQCIYYDQIGMAFSVIWED